MASLFSEWSSAHEVTVPRPLEPKGEQQHCSDVLIVQYAVEYVEQIHVAPAIELHDCALVVAHTASTASAVAASSMLSTLTRGAANDGVSDEILWPAHVRRTDM